MKSKRLIALALGVALLTAACGSSDGDGGTKSATPPGDPIVLGVIGSFTGPQAASVGKADEASKVWADSVNDAGGINGHPVKLFVEDDGGDPAKSLQAAKSLVEKDKVIAIVGNNSLVSSSWAKYVADKGVPVIGGNPTESVFSSDADFYPIGTNVITLIFGQFVRMKEAGLSKMGLMYCAESPTCAGLEGLAKAMASVVGGVEVVASAKVSATQPSYNAECLAMKNADADALFVAHNAASVVAITAGCAKVGYDPVDVSQSTTVSNQWLTQPQLDGALLTGPNPPQLDSSVPGIKAFVDALDKYEPGLSKSPQNTPNLLWAWLSGKLFEKVAEAAKISPTSTSADVKAGLYTIKDETLDGASPPLTFVKDKPTFVECWFKVDLKGGKVKSQSTEPQCLDADQLSQVQKILAGG